MDPACRPYPRQARTPFDVSGRPAVSAMCGAGRAEGPPPGLRLAAAAFAEAAPWREMAPAP